MKIKRLKVLAIIQARMLSSRLPNKMMLSLHGKPIIDWVCERVSRSNRLDAFCVAIPNTKVDDILVHHFKKKSITFYRGDEYDVLSRFYEAAVREEATTVVRICADNPLISPEEIDNLIEFFSKNDCDYAYNHIPFNNKYPDGLGAEICSMETLKKLHSLANRPEYREHLFNYMWDNSSHFCIKTFDPKDHLLWQPQIKLDLDTYSDYLFLQKRPFTVNMTSRQVISTALNSSITEEQYEIN
jgi:spore coat polysaccharide biosynthesis protein SpsF